MPRAESARPLPADVKAFIEHGVSVMVGTRDAELVPELVRAWGPHVSPDLTTVTLCIAAAVGARTIANLRDNGRVAVTFASPANSNAVQIWGRCTRTGPARRQDMAAVEAHRAAFVDVNKGLGAPPAFIEALWRRELAGSPEMFAIQFVAEQIFNQTPGPDAGSRL